jgi:hypothetical protein
MAQFIFQAPARINGAKTFSVEVNRSSLPFGGQPKPEVRLQLPPETDVVRWILTAERGNWARPQDPRAKVPLPQSILREARFSDKGKLMEGMLGLFGGLFETDQFLGRPFWQRLFRELAALDPKRDEILINETQNVLVKAFRGLDIERNRLEQAAKLVASRLSGRAQGQYRTLRQCERLRLSLAKTEKGQGHFAAGSTRTIIIRLGSFDRPRMLSEFDGLIARRVLRLGTALPCPRCGVTDWRSLDTLEQVTRCPGCDHEITVPMNQQGSVTLNSLVRMAVAQGVLGVIQAVSALGQRSESLFFMPSSNLYRSGEANPWREVDVAAIVNGELLLGEVKEGRIGPSDFDGLVEVAEVLRPAKAVLFIKQEEWRAELQTPFDAAKLRLAGHGVGLEVHHLIIV